MRTKEDIQNGIEGLQDFIDRQRDLVASEPHPLIRSELKQTQLFYEGQRAALQSVLGESPSMTPQHTTAAAAIEQAMEQLRAVLPPDLDCWVTIGRLDPTEKVWDVVGVIDDGEDFLKWMKECDRND